MWRMQKVDWLSRTISLENDARGKYLTIFRFLQLMLFVAISLIVIASSAEHFQAIYANVGYKTKNHIEWISKLMNQWQAWLVPLLTFLSQVCGSTASKFDTWKWSAIDKSLEGFSNEVFADHADDPESAHRVTLFRLQNGCIRMLRPPWNKYLVPIARSGTTTKRTRSIFQVHDEKGKIVGIAPKAWQARNGTWVWAEDIPALSEDMTEEEKREYYDKTGTTVAVGLKMSYDARSYAAIRMVVGGKHWGVLVLDSASTRIPEHENVNKMFHVLATGISPILEVI